MPTSSLNFVIAKNIPFIKASPPSIDGLLYAGVDRNVLPGTQASLQFTATFSGTLDDKTILWEQVSGEPGSFSSVNTLSTVFTTATDPQQNVILKVTVSAVTAFGVASISDFVTINVQPNDVFIANSLSSSSALYRNLTYYVTSRLGAQLYDSDGIAVSSGQATFNTIYWLVPLRSDYYGHVIELYDNNTQTWQNVRTVTRENDFGYYLIPQSNVAYRYIPLWIKNFKIIRGTSDGGFSTTIPTNQISSVDVTKLYSYETTSTFSTLTAERTIYSRTGLVANDSSTIIQTGSISYIDSVQPTRILYTLIGQDIAIDSSTIIQTGSLSYFDSVSIERIVYTLETLPV